jgi:hypothetical protein
MWTETRGAVTFTKEELHMELSLLAMYCQRVAEVSEANSIEADQARKLKQEWNLLIGSVRTQDELEAQMEQLRQRMLKFLSTVELPLLSRRSSA